MMFVFRYSRNDTTTYSCREVTAYNQEVPRIKTWTVRIQTWNSPQGDKINFSYLHDSWISLLAIEKKIVHRYI